jgi:hypothetical protein
MSRLPELEQELVATAARLSHAPRRLERRARTLVPAVALACLVAAALVASGLFDADDDAVRPGGAPTGAGFQADATLEDMFGIFRRPQTAADDMGITKDQQDEIPDRQPDEDFTQSRRVEWPGARIFLWPMRDGVCYGVAGGSGCLPLDILRRTGVSIGTQYRPGRRSVSGVVVDGVREVVLTAKGGPELRVPVRENFFFVDLHAAAAELGAPDWDSRVDRVHWRYAGQERSFSVASSFPDDAPPPDPNAGFDAVPGSFGEPVDFTAGGVSYSAVGYQATDDTICVRRADGQTDRPSLGCQGIRGLREALARQPAELFSAGGTANDLMVHTGFARADVVDAEAVGGPSTTVILSEPWSPAPWEGEPIRFLLVFAPAPAEIDPREITRPSLRVWLADGRSYLIES